MVFGVSGALCDVRDIAAPLECLPGLHPAPGHVSLFQGDWRLPAVVQQWAAHMAVYQISGGHSIQGYNGGGGVTYPLGAEGSVTWVPRSAESRGRVVFKAASGSSTAFVAANIDARALRRYLRRSTILEPPSKARQAVLCRLDNAVDPTGLGTPCAPAGDASSDLRGPGGLRAVTLNLRRGLGGKMQALGSCLRGWGYPDLVGLQEVGKLPARMVVHAMYCAALTPAAHPAAGVGVLVRWHPTFWEVGRDVHSSGRGIALEYRCRGGHILAVLVYFPVDQDLDVVRSILACALGVMAPASWGVYPDVGRPQRQPRLGDRFPAGPSWPRHPVGGFPAGHRARPLQARRGGTHLDRRTGFRGSDRPRSARAYPEGGAPVGGRDHPLPLGPTTGGVGHRGRPRPGRQTSGAPTRPAFPDTRPGRHGGLPYRRPARRGARGRGVLGTCRRISWPPSSGRWSVPTVPPKNLGSSQDAWTRSIVSSRHTLSGAHDCGSRWTPSKSAWICVRTWELGNLQRYLAHLPEVAPFTRPCRGAFRCLYGLARTPPVQPRFSAHVDVAPRARAKVALDQVRHRHQKTLRELTPGDVRALTGWVTPAQPLGFASATVPHLRRILQLTGNTAPARQRLQYWMLREMDDDGLAIVCEVVNRYMRGERLEALAHGDLHLLPKKPPPFIGANDRPLTNLVPLRKVVGVVVKEEEQPWLREHSFLPTSQFALWPGTSVWDFLRVLHDYFWHRWGSGGEAWPVLDDVRHAFGSPDHVSRDSVHQVSGYGPELCLLQYSLVEDICLDMGGTDDVDHAVGWFDVGSGQGCPLSPLDYAPMGEVRAKMVSKAYRGVLTRAGLLHSLAWADDTVWLGGSREDASAIAQALPAAEDAVALGSDVSKMHVLRTWMEGQRVRYGVSSVLMNGVRLPVPSETEYIRSLGRHALPHIYHKEGFRKFMTAARRASTVIPIKSLRAQYPPAMYNPKAGGMARFQAGVRPPPSPFQGVASRGPPRRLRPPGGRGGEPAGTSPARVSAGGALGHIAPGPRRVDHICPQLRTAAEPPQSPHPGLRLVGTHGRPLAV